jgi:AgrD protein
MFNMDFLNSIFSFVAKFFEVLGAVSGVNPCGGWLDEPEVPEELTKLYE